MTAIRARLEQARAVAPEPLQLQGEAAPPADFPVSSLGDGLRAAVEAIMGRAYVPPQTAVQSVLSAASLALQPHFNIVLPTGQVRPISLFLVTIAKSGARKSSSDDQAIAPLMEFQHELDQQHQATAVSATAQRAAWDIGKAEAIRKFKSRGTAELAGALEELGPRPAEPMKPVLIARVGTTQGLVKFFELSRQSLGLMSDEGGSWLGGYGMTEDNKLATIATLSDLWDGKPIQRMTGGEGMMVLYGRRLTFHLMIQPVLAGRLLGDAEMKGQGFLSRLLVTQPPNLAGTRIVDPDAIERGDLVAGLTAYTDRLGQIARYPLPVDHETGVLQPATITLSDQAQRMWWAFYNDLEKRVGPGGEFEDVDGFVGKLPEQAARLAAVLAAWEQGKALRQIDAATMARGIAIGEFYLAEAQRLFGVPPVDPLIVEAQALSDWLREKWTENLICIRRIQQVGPNQLRKVGGDRMRAIIDALVRHYHLGPRLPDGGMVSGSHANEAWRVMWPRAANE